MKKNLSFILVFTAVFTLLGCNLDQTSNEKAFKEYLQANKALTVEELDTLVTDSEVADMPVDLFTNLKLENIFIDGNYKVENQLEETDIYLWQNESKIYLASKPQNYEAEAYYFDLSALEVLYDEARKESQNEELKPSEMIDLCLNEVIASTAMPLDIDLETILGVASFDFNDFTLNSKGEYVLKNEVLFEKIAILSGMPGQGSELENQLKESGFNFQFNLLFDGKHITKYELNITNENDSTALATCFILNFEYEDDKLIGYSVLIDIEENGKIELSVELLDEQLSFEVKISGTNMPLPSSINVMFSKNKISILVKDKNLELLKFDLELISNKLGDITSFGLKGSIKVVDATDGIIYSTLDANITSGDAVIIPDHIKELESTALNGLDELGNIA